MAGRPRLPKKKCKDCGKSKKLSDFKRRGGFYKKHKTDSPVAYTTACKTCLRATNAKSILIKDYKNPTKRKTTKKGDEVTEYRRKIRNAKRQAEFRRRHGINSWEVSGTKKDRITRTRVRSMTYLAERGCDDCGERDPRILQYDHRDPSKKLMNIARMITNGYSWTSEKLRTEIKKCRVLCANCHVLWTQEQQGYYKDPRVQKVIKTLLKRYAA